MSKNINVPKLRFKEFSGEWEEKTLNDLGTFLGGGTPSRSNESYWEGNIPWISSSDILEDNIHKINISRFINQISIKESATKLIPKNSILFVSRVGVGKLAINQDELCTSQDFTNFIPKDTSSYYLGYLFQSKKSILESFNQGTSIKGFTKNNISTLKIKLPQKQEQEKIASFLTSVDKKIEKLSQKDELLQEYKKGIMQKIFSQEVRFKDDNGDEFPKWEEIKLGKYLTHKTHKNKENSINLVLSVSNKKGFITQDEQFDGYEVASKDTSGYKIVEKNEYAYNPSRINVGSIARLENFDIGIVSPMYVVFKLKEKLNPIFFDNLYQTHRFKHLIKVSCSGSVRDSLNFEDMANFKVKLPCIEEQNKIANFLSSIDDKIEENQKILEKTKEFKKALLQQMFI